MPKKKPYNKIIQILNKEKIRIPEFFLCFRLPDGAFWHWRAGQDVWKGPAATERM